MRHVNESRRAVFSCDGSDELRRGDVGVVVVEVPASISYQIWTTRLSRPHLVSQSRPTRLYTMSEYRRHSRICSGFLASHSYGHVSRASLPRSGV